MDFIKLMTLPFLECLVLVGIHSYLGLHVIRRRVIFVDLALAQIAALGTTIAFLFSINPHSTGAYIFSLLFTFVGAAVFSMSRVRSDRIPQEAVIGLVYALAAATGILIVYGAPHGAEHIQEVMTGSILWVKGPAIAKAAVAYAFVGLFHFVFRKRFLQISEDPEAAYKAGVNVRLWDFLFYMSFGLVITHSVQTAGVLLVFVFLVVPAIVAIMLTERLGLQLLIGWGVGTLVSVGGLVISYYCDLPSGPAVVVTYGATLLVAALLVYVVRSPTRGRAIGRVLGGVGVAGLLALGFNELGQALADNPSLSGGAHDHRGHPEFHQVVHAGHRGNAIGDVEDHGLAPSRGVDHGHDHADHHESAVADPKHLDPAHIDTLDMVQKRALFSRVQDADELQELVAASTKTETKLLALIRLLDLRPMEAGPKIVHVMAQSETSPLLRDEAVRALAATNDGELLGFDPWSSPESEANQAALGAWRARWR
jgi:ABC-type Mn2+/Zn2+ transport system permease subunit